MTAPLLWWLLEPAGGNPGSGRDHYSSPGHAAPPQQHAEGRGELVGYADIEGEGTARPTIFGTGTVVGVAANDGDGQAGPIDAHMQRGSGSLIAAARGEGSGRFADPRRVSIARQRAEDELLLLGLI